MVRNKIDIAQRHKSLGKPLILDGAMGSLLVEKNLPRDKFLWSSLANVTNSSDVTSLHKDYILAGADIITTNTFRTNPSAFKHSSYSFSIGEFVKAGVDAAIQSVKEEQIIIAGSNAPAEDCYQPERTISKNELEYNHKKHIELLWNYGCDVIWNETHSHMDEIEIICEFCSANRFPFVLSFYFTEELELLDGTKLANALEAVENYGPLAVGFNCIKQETLGKYLELNTLPKSWGFYFNCGAGNVDDEIIVCGIDHSSYANAVEPLLKMNPFFAGSCCGSSPSHTKALKEKVNEIYRN